MNHEDFLSLPRLHLFRRGAEGIPDDWLRSAWDDEEYRTEALYGFCRSVSKIGTLDAASDGLEVLARSPSAAVAVGLSKAIRDGTQRPESEWRDQFEAAFPVAASDLPPIDRHRELSSDTLLLVMGILRDRPRMIEESAASLREAGFTLEEAVMSGRDFSELAEELARPEAIEAIRNGLIPEVISALDLPRLLGKDHLLEPMRRAVHPRADGEAAEATREQSEPSPADPIWDELVAEAVASGRAQSPEAAASDLGLNLEGMARVHRWALSQPPAPDRSEILKARWIVEAGICLLLCGRHEPLEEALEWMIREPEVIHLLSPRSGLDAVGDILPLPEGLSPVSDPAGVLAWYRENKERLRWQEDAFGYMLAARPAEEGRRRFAFADPGGPV